jgi:hypothetical protein
VAIASVEWDWKNELSIDIDIHVDVAANLSNSSFTATDARIAAKRPV